MLQETNDAIHSINQDLYDTYQGCDEDGIQVEFASNSYIDIITFCGLQIWNSEDDQRADVNDDGDKESLEGYLRSEINRLAAKLSKIKL